MVHLPDGPGIGAWQPVQASATDLAERRALDTATGIRVACTCGRGIGVPSQRTQQLLHHIRGGEAVVVHEEHVGCALGERPLDAQVLGGANAQIGIEPDGYHPPCRPARHELPQGLGRPVVHPDDGVDLRQQAVELGSQAIGVAVMRNHHGMNFCIGGHEFGACGVQSASSVWMRDS